MKNRKPRLPFSAAARTGAALLAATLALPALADGPWLLRLAATDIDPKSDNGELAVGNAEVDNRWGPTVNLAYFFSPHLALDVLGGAPFKHDFAIDGAAAGSVKHLPPIVTLQYHFLPDAPLRPYVGAGFNYTFFLDEKLKGGGDLKLDDSFGLAAQAGVDLPITGGWLLGLDLRYADIDSEVSVNGSKIGTIRIDPLVYSLSVAYRF